MVFSEFEVEKNTGNSLPTTRIKCDKRENIGDRRKLAR